MLLTVHTSAHIYARTRDVPGSGYPGTVLNPYTDVIRAQIFGNVDIVRVQTLKGFGGFAIQLSGTWTGTVQFGGSTNGLGVGGLTTTPLARGARASSPSASGHWQGSCVGLEFLSGVALAFTTPRRSIPAHSASLLPRKSHYSGNALHPETHLT
jgi:hypothetical protein